MANKTALIFGISGQDGQWLALHLLKLGYNIVGTSRKSNISIGNLPLFKYSKIDKSKIKIVNNFHLKSSELTKILDELHPDEIYHLSSLSFVQESWKNPLETISKTTEEVYTLVESLRTNYKNSSLYFSGSSELFGNALESPQDLKSQMNPRSPYATSKLLAFHIIRNYRAKYGVKAYTGITYNHESELRPRHFATRKITSTLASIKAGISTKIEIGNIYATRDWGYAPDYVIAMHSMLQERNKSDHILCTGKAHTVLDILKISSNYLNINWEDHCIESQKDFREAEAIPLVGNPSQAKNHLNWCSKTNFEELICKMCDYDYSLLKEGEEIAFNKHLKVNFES